MGVAGGVVGGVVGVDERPHGVKLAKDLLVAAGVDHRQLGRDNEIPGQELALKIGHRPNRPVAHDRGR